MKKLIKYISVLLLFFIPMVIKGAVVNYEQAVQSANNYISSDRYNDRKKYLILTGDAPYLFQDNSSSSDASFRYGGLVNKSEYDLSILNNKTYLTTGVEYWTQTSSGEEQYYIESYLTTKNVEDYSGVRVTEFVKPEIKVTGNGTYANPWVFVKQYIITIKPNNSEYGTVTPEKQAAVYVDKTSGYVANAVLSPKKGYRYEGRDECNFVRRAGKYSILNITRDIECTAMFGYKNIKIKYDCNGGTPESYEQVVKYNSPFKLTDSSCTRAGYLQDNWIDPTNVEWTSGWSTEHWEYDNGDYGIENDTLVLKAKWNPNKLTINYYANGGVNQDGTTPSSPLEAKTYYYDETNFAIPNYSCNDCYWNLKKTGYVATGNWLVGSTNSSKKVYDDKKYAKIQDAINDMGRLNDFQSGDITIDLYAEWDTAKYSITLDNQGATSAGTTSIYEKYNTGYYLDSSLSNQMTKWNNCAK